MLQELASNDPSDPLLVAERCIAAQTAGAVATVIRSEHATVRVGDRVALAPDGVFAKIDGAHVMPLEGACHDVLEAGAPMVTRIDGAGGPYDVFVEPIAPPPRLFVLGAGHDAVPVVGMA
ncbi:MAG TPA: hypothetical protein VGH87_21735, partial [Polyangiaceae bacterium]